MKIVLSLAALLLTGCASGKPPAPPKPPESFDEMLKRTEYVDCATLTYHDYSPAPDCRKMYDAWHRGKKRYIAAFPNGNADWSMGVVQFYRPRLMQVAEKPYPLIADIPGNPRGVTYTSGGAAIIYAYEEVIEHEAVHLFSFLNDGLRVRTPEAIAEDMGGYSPDDFKFQPFYWFVIACHGTGDDPFGMRGDPASCLQPFSGPPNWREQIP